MLYDGTSPILKTWLGSSMPVKNNLDNCCNAGPVFCFLEVDLDYLDGLHDLHDYPLAI